MILEIACTNGIYFSDGVRIFSWPPPTPLEAKDEANIKIKTVEHKKIKLIVIV